MPVIDSLLRRAQANAAGVYVDTPWDKTPRADQPPLEQNWYAWEQAHIALAEGDLHSASGWLRAAEQRLAANDDPLCRAEVDSEWMAFADRLDEPRQAATYAASAWKQWFSLASAPDPVGALPSIRALMRVLAPDDDTPIDDARIFLEWMADRLTPRLQQAFSTAIRLFGTLGLPEEALAVAGDMRSWLDQYTASFPDGTRGVLYANLQETVGNLHDQLGNLDESYATFVDGIARLEGAIDHRDVHHLRARLQFNAANELSKMARYAEATPHFAEALAAFEELDAAEPALRARHALVVNRFKTGDEPPAKLRKDVEALMVAYESIEDSDLDLAVRQNLDAAYRLWLTLAAPETSGDEMLAHRFLGQLYALREGLGTFARDWTNGPEADPTKVILSEVAVLAARLSRLDRTVLLVLESGVDAVVATTIRSGDEPLTARVQSALAYAPLADALVALIESYREATNDLIQRIVPVKSPPSAGLMDACQGAWLALPVGIRDDLANAETIFVMLSNSGGMDEVPVELFHDGAEFLATRASVVRAASLKQLVASLGRNRVNVAGQGTALIVRADDVEQLGVLPNADAEVGHVAKVMESVGEHASLLTGATLETLVDALGGGVDLFHFVGHGHADDNGEMLVLGRFEHQAARAIDLRGIDPSPAPLCVMSSCELGRSRHLRSGEQRGVVVALLDAGAPVVVAATYSLPDVVGFQFTRSFYRHAVKAPVGAALLDARRAMAKSGVHPVAWASLVAFGDAGAPLVRESSEESALDWPSCLLRLVATAAPEYGIAAREGLESDARLTAAQRKIITETIDAFERGDGDAFDLKQSREKKSLLGLDAEAYLAYRVLMYVGCLRFGSNDKFSDDERRAMLSFLLEIRPMLEDSYLRVVLARECVRDLAMVLTTDQGRAILHGGIRALSWLSADAANLTEARQALEEAQKATEETVVVNAMDMIGVDTDTFQAADSGDRQAQKHMVRVLFTRRATVAALSSDEPWTTWMLRMIGSGSEQAICDLFGVIDQARTAGRLPPEQANAIDELIEQFIGPGEVRAETVHLVTSIFSHVPLERDVIALFLAHDRLASGSPDVTVPEIEAAIRLADDIGSESALTFFTGVWSQYAAQEGRLQDAVPAAEMALTLATKLASEDAEFEDRLGRTAVLLSQLYTYAGEPALAAAIQLKHHEAIAAYQQRESDGA